MKKAEIIKNGNVNLKTNIDWDALYLEFWKWKNEHLLKYKDVPPVSVCFFWLKERIEKELNSSQE